MNMMVSAAALGMVSPAEAKPSDPIYAAIDAHKTAKAAFEGITIESAHLEETLPCELRQSCIDPEPDGVLIVETDDARWIENTRAYQRLSDAETDAAIALVNTAPVTVDGLVALLEYATAADTDGYGWPAVLQDDEGTKTRSWQFFLIKSTADALSKLRLAATLF